MKDEIVYSTESGYTGKKPKKKKQKVSQRPPAGIKRDGIVRVQRESKGRGGKTVSIIYGLPLSGTDLTSFAARLKQKLGSGGTVKNGTIIIQGDKIDVIIQFIKDMGYNVKRAGG